MLKKTITYEDFDGETQSEDFYFNLSQADLVKLEVSSEDGFAEALQDLVKSNNRQAIIDAFERIILMSYGEKSPDGKLFLKEDLEGHALSQTFKQTAAYSALFVELTTDTGAAAAFVNAVIPKGLAEKVAANQLQFPTEPGERILELDQLDNPRVEMGTRPIENVVLPEDVPYMDTPAETVAQYDLAPEAEWVGKTPEELENMSQPELLQYMREQRGE